MSNRAGRPWRRVREYVLNRDRHQCQLRYPEYCILKASSVDHIVSFHDRPDLELDPTNLRATCRPCHEHRTSLQARGDDRPPHVEPSRPW